MSDCWQRIEKIQKWSKVSSISALAREIGLSRAENLYQIRKGNNAISRDLVDLFAKRYSELSKGWILTGEGNMLLSGKTIGTIPFYDQDVFTMFETEWIALPAYEMILPQYADCDFAAIFYRDSSSFGVEDGVTLLLKKVSIEDMTCNVDYVVVSRVCSGVFKLSKEQDCESMQQLRFVIEDGTDIIIDANFISRVYHIKGVIAKKI